ncbi:MAG: Rne/Rng family ribonuclease [Nitrospirae bacterium]|nr:Rne/Rng family ribonuclease [Nitrospirota bacterium]
MNNEIIINVSREEIRVALLENGQVAELYIDRKKEEGIVGNIYKGRVATVLPGMQASFIDIGLEKAAFLYATDVSNTMEEYVRFMDEDIEFTEGKRKRTATPIEDLLQEGQEIFVQVSKEPIGMKGARVTSYITLPGRYLVFMPGVDHIGVSRRIKDEDERKRLREIISKLKRPGSGYIVRTVSEGKPEEEFSSDMKFLELLWQNIGKKKERQSAPCLIHSDLDIIFRVVRDLFTPEIKRLVIDSQEEYLKVKDFVETYLPSLSDRIELYDKEEPIFDLYGIEIEIEKALKRKIWLKSGGYIVIDEVEALTAIDVNTGRYVGKKSLEETILKTNLEAAKEIAYQLRLRNIGGIIIVDFIDMEKEENRKRVYTTFQEALAGDKARINIFQISPLGLIEMTRKRVRRSLSRCLCYPCPYCEGDSYIKSPLTICYEIFNEIRRNYNTSLEKKVIVEVHPAVADLLYDEERQEMATLEKKIQKKIIIRADPNLHQEQYEIRFSS